MTRNNRKNPGFTLVEVIIVTAILGLLAVLVLVPTLHALQTARATTETRNITEVEKAKGQLMLPKDTIHGAMGATKETSLAAGTEAYSNLLLILRVMDEKELTVGNRTLHIGTMTTRASYK
jgi:prepilin-type N-terminal cleavage/methylation domain-containing protein